MSLMAQRAVYCVTFGSHIRKSDLDKPLLQVTLGSHSWISHFWNLNRSHLEAIETFLFENIVLCRIWKLVWVVTFGSMVGKSLLE